MSGNNQLIALKGNYTLNFTGCRYIGELHKILKETFHLPAYYGENLDALYDLLVDAADETLVLKIVGIDGLRAAPAEYAPGLRKVFEDAAKKNGFTVVYA